MMPRSMELGKRFFGEKLFDTIIGYLKKDPEQNLPRVIDLVERAPIAAHHKRYARNIRKYLEENPAMREYIQRIISEIDENVHNHLFVNFFVNASLIGVPKKAKISDRLGYHIPYTFLIDPTSKCNLRCNGCWAGAYDKHDSLSFEEVDRLVSEAKELGIHFIVMSGGEPLLWPHLEDLCRKHDDVAFMAYTNGTLIDENMARWMKEAGNFTPAISIEGSRETTDQRRGSGVYDKIMEAMDNLKENGVAFGFSITATNENWEEVFSDQFIDLMIDKGALYGWSFHYIPIGSNPDFSLMLNNEQRLALAERVRHIRSNKPIQVADFWNDGELTGGCIAGGRQYFHINAKGDVEPCAFVHYTVDNIKGKSLKDILANPLFKKFQEQQPFSNNLLRPCPLIDHPEKLRYMMSDDLAVPSYKGADAMQRGQAAETIDSIAANWKEAADQKWYEWYKELPEEKTEKELEKV